MNEHDWRERISIKSTVCHGKPCIKGTRIWVSLILDFLASGDSIDDVLAAYPHLTPRTSRPALPTGPRRRASGSSPFR